MLPEVVIYDVDLTLTLPPALSATSGLNAIAHAMEALYARDGNPIVAMMAEEGVRAFAPALPRIVVDAARPRGALGRALWRLAVRRRASAPSAWRCITSSAMCLAARSICRMPRPMRSFCRTRPPTTRAAAPEAMARLARGARASRTRRAGSAIWPGASARRVALRELGMQREGIARAVDLALANPYWNPRPIEREGVARLIEAAWSGSPPAVEQEQPNPATGRKRT